ncbi:MULTISPECIES: aminopeptidase N [Streptomyces]|uniref:Aminopeptidase N n=1 Tax=Streptomyces thermoviolaceus subsp. thermoviolaceus TaxID=66860 RepID=A0ABX0Z054_STRTL|nr:MULTISPECIES: aminopeptidase N [Streptomyces]MCM3266099.1 aminopeptidase N [Streptomyces thermoviolaceus]NJP16680.1 aminopeptidase N [Streptomyces thermoviolaceus subsp. thermoviolaceus]RSR99857.1 aminopeptidase N [Streptomyces sp. WAC00469]WTD49213.1 aminopeptidase N [Streptomyces thermoviolaceus]GGV80234.1 aminopeptidase N [Streptomyces thermoviolaceus subsp. apingens]
MPGTNLTREEAQQRAKLLTVDSYEIELDLSGAQEGGTYRSVTTVRFDVAENGAESFIDLVAPTVHEVVLNGDTLDPAEVFQDSRIALPGLLQGRNVLRVVADCAYTNTGEGLHRFVDPVDDQAYLYTQFEVPDARRVFACFEQPDLKATFQFTVRAPEGWTVVSNSPSPEPKDNVWVFEPTPRISTYITALIAGPYHSVHSVYEKDGQVVPLGIYCRPSLAEHLDADAIFEVTRQGFDWFQEKFDYAYPFKKYDQLFVPEFNAGAMENAGAVTIRDQYVFRSKVTDAAYEARAETILHELAHMWFGDLVTMEWWNDLWLNESFATYTSIACQAHAPGSRWPHAWTTFANSMKTWAYRQDQLPSTHPIMAEIRDLDDVLVNFDGITYAKGASVLKQLVAYVGMDEFFRGVQTYFKRHAYGNTRLSDLLGALEETSGRDLKNWSKKWLETAGINILRPQIETDGDGVITSFAVRQEAPALPAGAKGEPVLRPHRIAIGLYDLDGDSGKLVRTDRIELDVDGELTPVPQLAGRRRPAVILLNDDDLSYAKVRLDEESLRCVTEHLGDFEESLPRALCWASAWDMTRDAELAARDYLSLVLSGIGKESDIGVVQSLHRQVKLALDQYTDPAARDALLARWTDATLAHLRAARPGSDHQLAWARAFAATARTPEQLDLLVGLLQGTETIEGLVVDTELRWAFVQRLAATGRFDEAEIAAEYERDRTAAGERHAATARAARPTEEAKAEAWASVVDSDKLPNAVQEAVIAGFVQTDQRQLLAPYTDRYFEVVKDIWESRSHEMAQQIAVGLYPAVQVSEETLRKTDAWLESAEPNAALRRLVSESRAGVERALKAQAADAAAAGR